MNTRARKQTMRAVPKHDKDMEKEKKSDKNIKRSMSNCGKAKVLNRIQARRERKMALQQDVDKLKMKLRHEENVHRALERAFTRPLGALPRLPPYLPSHTLELLAEVAVLEEEVVRLEEQVVNFRQGLFQEAIISSSSKNSRDDSPDLKSNCQISNSESSICMKPASPIRFISDNDRIGNAKKMQRKQLRRSLSKEKQLSPNLGKEKLLSPNSSNEKQLNANLGKENQLSTKFNRNYRQSPVKKFTISKVPREKQTIAKAEPVVINKKGSEDIQISKISEKEAKLDSLSEPNKLSEEILKCLTSIFSQMNLSERNEEEQSTSPSISGSSSENSDFGDPFGILEFENRDIGSYKKFRVVDSTSFRHDLVGNSPHKMRLKVLLNKLMTVDLLGLTHLQKLAFWINIYNACMMNAFLEQGIPTSPQMLVALMPKATMNVGGQLLSAMSIEHFILRLPYNVKHVYPKGIKDEMTMRGIFGLEWPEPLVTFALSCGSYSSPAVRVYTPCHVEEQLETAKKEYLQASICISNPNKLSIPKLLHWYLLDFAKDLESLMDWICMQLPDHMRNNAIKSVEISKNGDSVTKHVMVLPYEFRFRYLLAC
ncbi:hypothetical protein LUZ60_002693 [Juncus effusus]|nr:hypothetical protein LUZ60_002693 [Juncus effusus]